MPIAFPNAKINIGLNIISKRPDGFHNIESIFYPVPLRDRLEITKSTTFSFEADGPGNPVDVRQNLVVKAFLLIQEKHNIGTVSIKLHKEIPVGAGLGGGSADAAFTLLRLNELFELHMALPEMESLALKLGSDCPFFIRNKPAFVTGRGEIFEPVSLHLQGKFLILVKPTVSISTAQAFTDVVPQPSLFDLKNLHDLPLSEWQNRVKNDFEEPIFLRFPALKQMKKRLIDEGAFYASMTGSGSAIYGLFSDQENARETMVRLSGIDGGKYWLLDL